MRSELIEIFIHLLLGLALVSLLCNLVLILVVLKLPTKTREARLTLALAGIEVIQALTSAIIYCGRSIDETNMVWICRFKGPLSFLLIFTSMMLVSIISFERCAKVTARKVSWVVWTCLSVATALFFSLVAAAMVQDQFTVSSSGLDCAMQATSSLLSALLISILGISLLALLLATLFNYVRLLFHVSSQDQLIELKTRIPTDSIESNPPWLQSQPVIIRVLSISLVYLLLIAPSGILILTESLQLVATTEFTSLFISIFLSAISIANPCLILFAHTLIYHQFATSLNHFFHPS